MTDACLTLSGSALADARTIATYGVLDAALVAYSGANEYDPMMPVVLSERVLLLAAFREPYDESATISGDDVATLVDVAREAAEDASRALADDAEAGARECHYREQWACAARVIAHASDYS